MPSRPALRPCLRPCVAAPSSRPLLLALSAVGVMLGLSGCMGSNRSTVEQMVQRQKQMQLQIEQLERRLNQITPPINAGSDSKIPAGAIRSLTYRSGTSDDRLRIYWADGKVSDLPCTKEQNTLVCG